MSQRVARDLTGVKLGLLNSTAISWCRYASMERLPSIEVDASQHQISRISLRCRMLWLRWLKTIRPCFEMMYYTLTNRWRFRYERFSFQNVYQAKIRGGPVGSARCQ